MTTIPLPASPPSLPDLGRSPALAEIDVSFPTPSKAWDLMIERVTGWVESGIGMLPNLVAAILVIALFIVLGRTTKRFLAPALQKVWNQPTLTRFLSNVAGVTMASIGLIIALEILDLDKTVTSLLAGAGVVGLIIGFAFQNLAANFMAGTVISLRRPFAVGEIIETNDHFGTVEQIDLRATLLRTPQGQNVILPNKEIFENPMVNFSRSGKRRVDLEVGVSYGEDLARVREVAVEVVEALETRDTSRGVDFFYTGFGDSSINFVVRFWVDYRRQPDYLSGRSEAIECLKAAFDEKGIVIPFPIRTLDFGAKGGVTLTEAARPLARSAGDEGDGGSGGESGGEA